MRTFSAFVVATLVLLVPSIAVADQARVTDNADDVYGSVPEGFEQVEPVGTHVNTDLRRTRVEHRARALVVVVRYVELAKGASTAIRYQAYLKLPRGGVGDLDMMVEIRPSLRRATVRILDFMGDVVCPGARAMVKPGKDRLTVRIPRACLGDPAWIRYRGQTDTYDEAGRMYLDYDNTPGSEAKASQQTRKLYAG